jgi:hypothetical protein
VRGRAEKYVLVSELRGDWIALVWIVDALDGSECNFNNNKTISGFSPATIQLEPVAAWGARRRFPRVPPRSPRGPPLTPPPPRPPPSSPPATTPRTQRCWARVDKIHNRIWSLRPDELKHPCVVNELHPLPNLSFHAVGVQSRDPTRVVRAKRRRRGQRRAGNAAQLREAGVHQVPALPRCSGTS